jgi:single-stranded DNA-binding protein
MEVKGKVKLVRDEEQVSPTFTKRELIVSTEEQYPQHIPIQFNQGKCNNELDQLKEGQDVSVSINLKGREWTNPEGKVVYFGSIEGWRVVSVMPAYTDQNTPAAAQPAAASAPAPAAQTPVAPSQRKLVMIATDATYEAYIKAGWTDALLLQHGKAQYQTLPPSAPAPAAAPSPELF